MNLSAKLKISGGEDPSAVESGIQRLVNASGWELVDDHTIRKTYHCSTWTKVLDFCFVVGVMCKSVNHHPVIELKYSSITFTWSTHSPPGLSHKDVDMADFCEQQAGVVKTVSPNDAPSCGGLKASQA